MKPIISEYWMIVCRHLVPTSGHVKESGKGEKNAAKHDLPVQNIVSQLDLKNPKLCYNLYIEPISLL